MSDWSVNIFFSSHFLYFLLNWFYDHRGFFFPLHHFVFFKLDSYSLLLGSYGFAGFFSRINCYSVVRYPVYISICWLYFAIGRVFFSDRMHMKIEKLNASSLGNVTSITRAKALSAKHSKRKHNRRWSHSMCVYRPELANCIRQHIALNKRAQSVCGGRTQKPVCGSNTLRQLHLKLSTFYPLHSITLLL